MNIFQYIKDGKRVILCFFISLAAMVALLLIIKAPAWGALAAGGIMLIGGITAFIMDFAKKHGFYKKFLSRTNALARPYDICKSISRPGFFEGDAILDTLDFCLNAQKKDLNIAVPEYVFLRKELFEVMRQYNRDFSEKHIACALKNLECSVFTDKPIFTAVAEAMFSYAARRAAEEKPFLKWYAVHNEEGVLLYAETNAVPGEELPWQLSVIEKLCRASEIKLTMDFTGRTLIELEFPKPTRNQN